MYSPKSTQKRKGMAHLKVCKECGKEVSKNAKVCPHCGEPKPVKKDDTLLF